MAGGAQCLLYSDLIRVLSGTRLLALAANELARLSHHSDGADTIVLSGAGRTTSPPWSSRWQLAEATASRCVSLVVAIIGECATSAAYDRAMDELLRYIVCNADALIDLFDRLVSRLQRSTADEPVPQLLVLLGELFALTPVGDLLDYSLEEDADGGIAARRSTPHVGVRRGGDLLVEKVLLSVVRTTQTHLLRAVIGRCLSRTTPLLMKCSGGGSDAAAWSVCRQDTGLLLALLTLLRKLSRFAAPDPSATASLANSNFQALFYFSARQSSSFGAHHAPAGGGPLSLDDALAALFGLIGVFVDGVNDRSIDDKLTAAVDGRAALTLDFEVRMALEQATAAMSSSSRTAQALPREELYVQLARGHIGEQLSHLELVREAIETLLALICAHVEFYLQQTVDAGLIDAANRTALGSTSRVTVPKPPMAEHRDQLRLLRTTLSGDDSIGAGVQLSEQLAAMYAALSAGEWSTTILGVFRTRLEGACRVADEALASTAPRPLPVQQRGGISLTRNSPSTLLHRPSDNTLRQARLF